VIAIIGILAGLLVPLAGIATTKMRIARVKAELNAYVNAIETYKLETGEYPPDNGNLKNFNTNNNYFAYQSNAALNPLFYELTGTLFKNTPTPGYEKVQDRDFVPVTDIKTVFKVEGLRNSARVKEDIDYKGFSVKESQTQRILPSTYGAGVEVLVVPVPGPFNLVSSNGTTKFNPWFYDASSTNRHNKNSFDLWAEISVGGKNQVIGNWKN
jgi:type II secretory pathway pseudopilin PulG